MSENNNVSIDEIIKRAQRIKAEAEKQLQAAEKSLDEKAKAAIDEVVVDEKAVADRIARAYEAAEEEEVKEFIPSKKKTNRKSDDKDDEDMKIASPFTKKANENDEPKLEKADGKTRNIELSIAPDKTKVIPDRQRTDEKTRIVSLVSNPDEPEGENGDLQKIPTIVSSAHAYDNFSEGKSEFEEESGVQIKLAGFDDKIESVPTIDEEVAEKELEKRREEKIGKFRLFGPEETDTELGSSEASVEDYEEDDERDTFISSLFSKRAAIGIRLITTAILSVLLILMASFKESVHFPLFLSAHTVYFGVCIAIYALIILINLNVITHGFSFKKSLNFDFPVSVTSILILAHTVALMIYGDLWIDNGVLLAPAGAFALFMSQLGKYNMMSRLIDNFEFITGSGDKFTVENITNSVDAKIIGRGMVEAEEPRLKISVKSDFPTNFLEISCKREPADKLARRLFIVGIILSVGLFFAVMFLDNINTAINCALCAFTISLPASALFITNSMVSDISSQLISYGSRVCGYEGAYMAQNADAVVMEAADLFDKNSCDLHGIKTFGGTKVDDAIINAAAVIIQTKSPLAHVFDDVIIGQQSILPKVESVQYEEKMGTSAWIYKRKVLVGTREMMLHHDVSVPNQSFEDKYTVKDRKALYLAVDGTITAMFIVSYSADPDLKRELRKLEKSGITLMVKSADPYINEESLCALFALPEGFIRVMNYSASRVYDKYSALHVEKSPAYVVHSGSALGLVSAMRGAGILIASKGLVAFLQTFGSILGFVAIAFLSVVQAYSQLSAINIILFEIIWTGFMFIVSRIRGTGV